MHLHADTRAETTPTHTYANTYKRNAAELIFGVTDEAAEKTTDPGPAQHPHKAFSG